MPFRTPTRVQRYPGGVKEEVRAAFRKAARHASEGAGCSCGDAFDDAPAGLSLALRAAAAVVVGPGAR